MPRRKAAEIEILPSEDDQQPRGRKKLVEAEHTIKYSAPVPVTVEDDSEEDNQEAFDFVEEEKAKRRRKTAKDERDDLKREFDKLGVASVSRLKLSIDKYRHSDSDDSGTLAEKDYCTKYPVTKEHILNDDYMDVARRYGAGRYWFTLRMDNKIVRQWERQVNQSVAASGPMIQHINPADPNSPQVIIQSINGDGQAQQIPMSIKDIMKAQREALKEQLEMAKLMREAYGFAPEQSQQPKSEEEVLASAILKQPDVIENVVGNVIKRFGGKGAHDDEPWYADMVRKAIESGQGVQIVRTAIDGIFNGFRGLFPGGNNNGQAPVGAPPMAPMANQQNASAQAPGQALLSDAQGQGAGAIPETVGSVQGQEAQGVGQQQQITPEQHALSRLIENCRRGVPVQVAFQQLIGYADAVNEQAPDYSIDGYIDLLGSMPTDAVIEFVKSLPNGKQIASLPHAQQWTAELQRLIKESQEGEE